ncbi:MAG: DUF424 family protein [Thermoplasmata archaeon]|jgi:hypothetical protein|nr:DUF424 family protein [Thermoplasmata archaeon]MCI4359857.1 DUF424 family protein [Thermoplasmata archaeon]
MNGGIVMRVHQVRSEFVVAACDAELIGRDLPVGTAGRTVKISSHFYGERTVTPEELSWALKRATIANLLGERTLAVATSEGFLAPGSAGLLGGVPHAEIFALRG